MREELRRNTSVGNKTGIDLFMSILFDKEITTCEAIRSLCAYVSSSELNYLAALYLFDDLQIIQFDGKKLKLLEQGLLLANQDSNERLYKIGCLTIERVIHEGLLNCSEIKYSTASGSIEFPINAFSLSGAVYRNLLITISALFVINGKLSVASRYEKCFEKQCSIANKKITQDELLKQLEKQQLDGELAELFVISYENRRLSSSDKTAKRISQIDVSAGYDILSYENDLSEEYDCYIEVKSYHGKPHFYWSDNERNTSKALTNHYCLFLIDIDRLSDDNYEPIIIRDPYNNLHDDKWLIKPQTYFVCQI